MANLNVNTSIVDYLKSKNLDSSFSNRKKLFSEAGMTGNYTGSADQNVALLGYYQKQGSGAGGSTGGGNMPTANLTNVINQNQDEEIDSMQNKEVPTRDALEGDNVTDIYSGLQDLLTGGADKPNAPSFEALYGDYREAFNLDDLESQAEELSAQEEDLVTQKRISVDSELGKPVAMNVIQGRVGEQERNFNERIDVISRQKNRISNQIKNAYDTIDTIMKYKKMDYDMAKDDYDKQFSQNLQMFNSAQGYIDKNTDNARANAQILINELQQAGVMPDSLSTETISTLTKLGLQSGLGANFYIDVLSQSTKPVLTHVTSKDKSTVTVIYKDGSTKMFSTGITNSDEDDEDGETATYSLTMNENTANDFEEVGLDSSFIINVQNWLNQGVDIEDIIADSELTAEQEEVLRDSVEEL
jgi:hypothetical protein